MATARVMPPGNGNSNTISFGGRSYTCALGSSLDVPSADAGVMAANGWLNFGRAHGGGVVDSGATTARPANPSFGRHFLDTTLNAMVAWDGVTWRNYAGASV